MLKSLPIENQRIKILREHLKMSQIEFAELLGRKQGSISDIERGRNAVDGIVQLLELKLNLNKGWLETGEGNMFKSKNILNEPDVEYKMIEVKINQVPIYDVEFSAGIMTSLIENRDNHFPVGYLAIPEVNGCDAIIRAKGDSMADRINDRDWIGIKRMDLNEWFPMGYIYAIETEQAQIIKYIKQGAAPDMLKIVSHNTFYDEEEIPRNIIKELWSVRTVLPFSKIETLI
ncbi:XRE family transcriptional regulator [Mucilaginibacter sp. L196]|uniref:XRE family transcriptional regulator n=1 Tax=Mucilaginibacter sp. L196 TaxID=1641870 RepID=UPI00131E0FA9|nr:XRE family transcriptional regulator [Mucilaginibacter sp. L196]